MPETIDGYSRRRPRSPSDSPDPDREQRHRLRARDDDNDNNNNNDRGGGSRHCDRDRNSRRDGSRRRRRSSRSPEERGTHKRDHRHHYRDRGRGEETPEDKEDRRQHQHRPSTSYQRSSHRRHHDRKNSAQRRRDDPRSRSLSRRSRSPDSRAPVRSTQPLPPQKDSYTSSQMASVGESTGPPPLEKEKPNFAQTGRLAAESKTVDINGSSVVLKYHEPPEARKPPAKEPWRLYVFKEKDLLEIVELNVRSCWLIGREHLVVDFPLEHPSCSKQHAALQFRFVEKRNQFGDRIGSVKPYTIDLESANGTTVNGSVIPAGRYVELRDKDVLQFGLSTREYVLILSPL
ncbi:SMAD/FHA domain-containing protein [Aspergillus heteromorphus CBS 117.55]|uniref:SMAD/FHA domain-containing protein n=1 Tax=Aspergillus heteromorphus CBS 117.55 TaxID=1448321 RepID=A0A317V6J3_9EURO|nr:SMAD/FHA domain-containing protein [Aspergillus heteromorphus CBS 117.55]PWY69686.1 SMAD/FHA domain-containing protein [Aspergillus heteromorphus CBS 117.55]